MKYTNTIIPLAFSGFAACKAPHVETVPSALLPELKATEAVVQVTPQTFEEKFTYVLEQGYTLGKKSNNYRISQLNFFVGDVSVNMFVRDLNKDEIPDLELIVNRSGTNDRIFFWDYDQRTATQDHPDVIKRYLSSARKPVDLTTAEGKEFVVQAQTCYIELIDAAVKVIMNEKPEATDRFIENYTKIMIPPSVAPSEEKAVPVNLDPSQLNQIPVEADKEKQ